MIVVNATLVASPGKREELRNVFAGLLVDSRGDRGCISYRFYQDVESENSFVVVEEWENQDALDDHWRTAHFDRLLAALPNLIAAPPEVKVYEVSLTKGMEAIEAARG